MVFLVLFHFFSFDLGLCLRSGHYKLSAGRPLLVNQLSRDNKREQGTLFLFPCYVFVEIIFIFHPQTGLPLQTTNTDNVWIVQSEKKAGELCRHSSWRSISCLWITFVKVDL